MAVHLFGEKGYHHTSIQEIAAKCKISKGGFYKHFASKEKLLLEVVKDTHQRLFQKTSSNAFSSSLSPMEKLEHRIIVELEQLKEYSSIYLILFKEFPPSEQTAVSEMMETFRSELIEWHKQCLGEAFGSKSQPLIWDMVLIYEGILREYISLILFHQADIEATKLARLMVISLDAVIEAVQEQEPVVSRALLFPDEKAGNRLVQHARLQEIFQELEEKITNLSIPEEMKVKLMASLQHLTKLSSARQEEAYLQDALVSYLKNRQELKDSVQEMEMLMKDLYGRGDQT